MFLSKRKRNEASSCLNTHLILLLLINNGLVHYTKAQTGSSASEESNGSAPEKWVISFCMPVNNNVGQMLRLIHDNYGQSQTFIDSADVLTQSFTTPVNSNAVYVQVDRSSTVHLLQSAIGRTHVELHIGVLLADNTLIIMDTRHSTLNTAAPSDRCDKVSGLRTDVYNVIDHKDGSSWKESDRYAQPISEVEIASIYVY